MNLVHYGLAALICAVSSMLANQNLAVYNDGFRPVYTEYFAGRMDRKALAATSFAVSFGLIVGFGFTNSIAMGIIIIHTFLLMGDIIGVLFKDDKKGLILSGIVGAAYGILVVAAMTSIAGFFAMLPVNFLAHMGSVSGFVIATFAIFPPLAIAYQHGVKKGLFSGGIVLAVYILVKKFAIFKIGEGTLAINAEGIAMLVGTIMLIVYAARTKKEASGAELSNIFSDNVKRIRKNWFWFAIAGGLIAAGASTLLLTTDVISGPLMMEGKLHEAALVAFVRAIGYIPLVYTTAIVTGVFSPAGSYFVMSVGILASTLGLGTPLTIAIAFVAGAATVTVETLLLGTVGTALDKLPALREMGDHIRNAMSQILEVALLVGGFVASQSIMAEIGLPAVGPMVVMLVWLLNKTAKKPLLIPLAVGPVVTIAMGILANILVILKIAEVIVK